MQALAPSRPHLSVIIPARDEAGAIGALLAELAGASLPQPYEIIVVDDGSTDGTADAVRVAAAAIPGVRLIRHAASAGKSRAIQSGALLARGDILVTVDGDGQNDPAFLSALIAPLADPAIGLVAGQRTRRHDGHAKKLGSRLANAVRAKMLGDATADTACGLKAIRRAVYLRLPYFDNNHRFYPALVLREGFSVSHVPVADRPRLAGRSKYGLLDRALVGVPDLIGVWWLRRRSASVPAVTMEKLSHGEVSPAAEDATLDG